MASNTLGRPSSYDPQIADSICHRLSSGESLFKICQSEGFPSSPTVFKWLRDFPDFLNSYARARETQAELMAEQILAIADSADAESYNPARLQVDARKWLMSKLAPKKYGDATILKHADANGNQLEVQVTRVSPRPPKVIDVTPTAGARRRLPAADDGVARGTASEGAD